MSRVRRADASAVDGIAGAWRRRLTARSADATAAVTGRRMLVVAPHPDDETFGCGALIARARAAGTPVTVVVATDGARCTVSDRFTAPELAAVRSAELRQACARLGVTDVVELGHPDGALDRWPGLATELAGLIADRSPEVVLTPCAQDPHPDHLAAHSATLAAMATVPVRPLLLGYPVWTWYASPYFRAAPAGSRLRLQIWAVRQLWSAPWWRLPAGDHLAQKEKAMAAYRSQTTNLTGEPGWSYLRPEFVRLFLGPDEMFLPVGLPRVRPVTAVPGSRRSDTPGARAGGDQRGHVGRRVEGVGVVTGRLHDRAVHLARPRAGEHVGCAAPRYGAQTGFIRLTCDFVRRRPFGGGHDASRSPMMNVSPSRMAKPPSTNS